jgi:regulator of protease activity HflC (stomatin/prohibitin superfamily)
MISRGKAEKQAARAARLSKALRENLKRRKAQARGRAEDRAGTGDEVAGNAIVETHAPDFRRNRGSD